MTTNRPRTWTRKASRNRAADSFRRRRGSASPASPYTSCSHHARWSAATRRTLRPVVAIAPGARAITWIVRPLFGTGGRPVRTVPATSRSKSSAVMPGMQSNRLRSRSRFMAGRPKKYDVVSSLGSSGTRTSVLGRIPKS